VILSSLLSFVFSCEEKEEAPLAVVDEATPAAPATTVQQPDTDESVSDNDAGDEDLPDSPGSPEAPVTADSSDVMAAEGETIVQLNYTADSGVLADSCTISDLHLVSVSTACTCLQGVCSVGIRHQFPFTDSWGYFHFTVTANDLTSNAAKVTLTSSCEAIIALPGARMVADATSCPDYGAWNGSIVGGDILILQEGGPTDNGGVIKAFDENGCYKGLASSEESPGYAVGLKVEAYGNSITTYNMSKILLQTRVNGNNPGIYSWDGPLNSGAQASVVLQASNGMTNPAVVPDDDVSGLADPHLVSVGMSSVRMRYAVSNRFPIGANGNGSPKLLRLVANNDTQIMKAYIDGVEKAACEVDFGAPTENCPNCVSQGGGREITDIHLGVASWHWNRANYIWSETRTIDGLPRTYWGVGQMNICKDDFTGFASLNHQDLVSNDELATSFVRVNGVAKTFVPGGTKLHEAIFASYGAGISGDMLVARYLKGADTNYTRSCPGFVGQAKAVYQNNYTNNSPNYGHLYAIETDDSGTHIRVYDMSASDEGKLVDTIYSEANPTVFNQSFSLGAWISVVPKINEP
jgi:hypothetical protein